MKRRVQCMVCPWRVDCEPTTDIPNGYCETKHRNLKDTIAEPGALRLGSPLRVMACHESKPRQEVACVGWLANQLGPGNNLGLRLRMLAGDFPDFELVGEQHACFEDTLP